MKSIVFGSFLASALLGAAFALGAQGKAKSAPAAQPRPAAQAQDGTPKRPKILGIAHVAFATDDFENSRKFLSDYLGYTEVHALRRPNEKGDSAVWMTDYKVNDEQWIELFPENPTRANKDNKLKHIAFLTDDAEAMRLYLASKGCKVPAQVNRGKEIDNMNFMTADPNGVMIEIVQYPADGSNVATRGQFLSPLRLSSKISHVGFTCSDVDKALDFYTNVLGFTRIWQHGPTPDKVGWIHLRFPDSDQTIELMLSESPQLTKAQLGSQNHICLQVKDIKAVEAGLAQRTLPPGCKANAPATGKNDHRRQLNVYNSDGTRFEYMEDHTWDGTNPPSSTGEPMRKAAQRPKLLGISHIAFATDDMANTRSFFSDWLGYTEVHAFKRPNEKGDSVVWMTDYKVDDQQTIQLFAETPDRKNKDNKMTHIAFLTDDVEAMRLYLASKGYTVPDHVTRGKDIDNINCFIHDPNGVGIELVQYPADGFVATTRGQFLSSNRVSPKIGHAGVLAPDPDAALKFYVDVLGFKEVWRGGFTPDKVLWIYLQFPDSDQCIELMCYDKELTAAQYGSKGHLCLDVKDIYTAEKTLSGRTLPPGCKQGQVTTGTNNRRQFSNLNVDGTRVEIMEDHTTDGKPATSSTGEVVRMVGTPTAEKP